jgi:hypothetical protein
MARGDLTVFEEFALTIGEKKIAFGVDDFKVALIDDTAAPTAADATPTWSDYSANEVSGTNYTAGGYTLTGDSWTEAGGVATFDDTGNVTWSQHASGPTDIYWGILYSDTSSNDDCICFIDMGGPISLVDGDISITWNASGIFTITVS